MNSPVSWSLPVIIDQSEVLVPPSVTTPAWWGVSAQASATSLMR